MIATRFCSALQSASRAERIPTVCRVAVPILVGLFLVAHAFGASPASEPARKRVLVIYSDERLLPANVVSDEAIRKTFAADKTYQIEFHSEFLDVSRFSGEAHQRRLADFFNGKYAERPPDLIIAGGQAALKFFLKYRPTLFTQVPVVYHGLAEREFPPDISDPRVVGVPALFEFSSTVELALRLHPQTREIVVIAGVSPRDVEFTDAARQALQPFEGRVRFRWPIRQSLAEVKRELSQLPDHTVVLYLTMFEDRAGETFLPREALAQFAPSSRAPIYAVFDTYTGFGIVGGSMNTFEAMAQSAARAGLRILAGVDPQAAVRQNKPVPVAMFDARQLRRAGVSEAQLPPGSVVRFREASVWQEYRWQITALFGFCIAETGLIVALVMQLRRRRRAEALRIKSDEQTRLAAEAARESESRFSLIANSAPVLIWMSGADKLGIFFNKPWLDFTGRTLEQELGNGWADAIHPEDCATALKTCSEAFESRAPFSVDFRLRRHDGQYRWVSDHAIPRFDGSGNFLGYIGSCTDITERKESEDRCRRALIEVEEMKDRLDKENDYLRQEMKVLHRHHQVVGQSTAIQQVLGAAEQVAGTDSSVLLLGETGTGKELIARAIHNLSPRREKAMVCVNCAAIPATLVESELFGREKGAYTGAMTKQLGRFEAAHRSTLFLDEVGDLPQEIQVKLLRVLQEKQIERLGSPNPIAVDVRIIAATNRDLEQAVREGRFRQDLYYRLTVFPIKIPPLRERAQDIPLLVMAFVEELSKSMGKQIDGISRTDLESLQRYHWPGNVRELRNAVERAMILASGSKLRIKIPDHDVGDRISLSLTLEDIERQHILRVLEIARWRVQGEGGAASLLGLKRTTLESRMMRLGIRRPEK
jgi:PAS domain S-box-containing protein